MGGQGLDSGDSPPSYDATADTEAGAGAAAAPPTYDSLYDKLKTQKDSSSGNLNLVKRITNVICGTALCTVITALFLGIPISMITIGAVYLHDCPLQRYIPIYLVVAGSFGVARNLCCIVKVCKRDDDADPDEDSTDYGALVDMFMFAWLIAGSVWVYSNYGDVNYADPLLPRYCHETVYKFAFGMITATWSLVGLVFFCVCCAGCAMMACS